MQANWPALFVFALLTFAASAQESSVVIHNSGEPMRVDFPCTEKETQAAGLLCTEEDPCSVYLELNSIASDGKKLFVAGNLHATSATISSILLSSEDSGLTWKEPAARIAGSALERLEFYDLDHGWAAGETQYPLPRDPFFLITSDGGVSWRQKPVTEEGAPGSVQLFWFDSAQHGELVVDAGRNAPSGRYWSYESETGGDSWMIRGTSGTPPKLKRAPLVDDSDFRIRPNPDGKAYEIERRSGEKWERISSFLIEAASCRIKSAEAKEPEAEAAPGEKAPKN